MEEETSGLIQLQQHVFTSGTSAIEYFDPRNTHPYDKLDIDIDATGKPTGVQTRLDGQPGTADFSSVGQVLGSALGRALAPNNQFVQLAAGTVVGAIGQRLAQAFAASLSTDGAGVNLQSTFADFNVSIAGAGASSVASFLVAELGTALHLDGFGAQLFNASIGGFTGSVASQIASNMAQGASFNAAIDALKFGDAAISAGYAISAALGSYLGHELVPATTHEGAVGGQLLGAVGSAIGISAALGGTLSAVLGFIVPGVGALIGTVLGTAIGNAIGSAPSPSAVDLLDQAGDHYGFGHYQSADGGGYVAPDQMAAAAVAIINGYLAAAHGAAIDHYKQATLGYSKNPDVLYVSGTPGHTDHSFVSADDAVHAAALDVLQNLEVIGGDLLLKRAHQNSSSIHPEAAPAAGGIPGQSQISGAEQLVTMGADLRVAQDYENYLNNREAINAVIATYPDSAWNSAQSRRTAKRDNRRHEWRLLRSAAISRPLTQYA